MGNIRKSDGQILKHEVIIIPQVESDLDLIVLYILLVFVMTLIAVSADYQKYLKTE